MKEQTELHGAELEKVRNTKQCAVVDQGCDTITASSYAIIILTAALLAVSTGGFSFSSIQKKQSPTNTKFDTKVAVNGQSVVTVYPPSHAASNNLTLATYMRLPEEQYVLLPMPLGSSLTQIEEEKGKNNPDGGITVPTTQSS